ncbi:MAG: hypothetical protein L0Y60_04385 [Beijerinckiaceae bacterium]|nr:hypothetical protein [Beijerinckiaceae bacterium]
MIRIRVSGAAVDVVQALLDQAAGLSPLANWKGFYEQALGSSKAWRVWLQRFDATARELFIVETSGVEVPGAGSPFKSIPLPALSGFSITFTPIGGPSTQIQTTNNGAGYGTGPREGGSISVPFINVRLSAHVPNSLNNLIAVANKFAITGGTQKRYYYKSDVGAKDWEIYILDHSLRNGTEGSPAVFVIVSMGGSEIVSARSEIASVNMPTTYTESDPNYGGSGTKTLAQGLFTQLEGPLQIFPT